MRTGWAYFWLAGRSGFFGGFAVRGLLKGEQELSRPGRPGREIYLKKEFSFSLDFISLYKHLFLFVLLFINS